MKEKKRGVTHFAKYANRWTNSCFYTFRDLKVAKCQKAVCGDIRHHEKAKCWKGQAAKRGQFGAKKANIHWFKKLKRAGKGQAWCKKANIYWLKEWSHIGRHLLQRLFRNGWSRNNLNLLKKEKNKNTTSPLKYNPTHLSRTFPFFQGAHKQNPPPVLHIKREDTKGQMFYLPFCPLDDLYKAVKM